MSKRKLDEFEEFDFTEETPKKQKSPPSPKTKSTQKSNQKTPVNPRTTSNEGSPSKAKTNTNNQKLIKKEEFKTPEKDVFKTPQKEDGTTRVFFKNLIQKSFDQLTQKPWREAKGVKLRQVCRDSLISAFGKTIPEEYQSAEINGRSGIEEYKSTVEIIVWAIEGSIYDTYFVFNPNTYTQQIRALCRHIPANPIRFFKLDPSYVATMSIREMVGDFTNIQIFKEPIKQKNIFNSKSEFPCRMCHKKNVSYYQLQLRSGDENGSFFLIFYAKLGSNLFI